MSNVYQFVEWRQLPLDRLIFLAPCWKRASDKSRLDYHARQFIDNGVMPDAPEIYLINNTPLSDEQIADMHDLAYHVTAHGLPVLQNRIAIVRGTSAHKTRSGRSQSNAMLYARYEAALLQYIMTCQYQHTPLDYHLICHAQTLEKN